MDRLKKLEILADAAKYDASCASSGAGGRDSRGKEGMGVTTGQGICHSYTPDGRCVSLLKVLLTNFCLYDCQYCVNRRSSDVQRARFAPEDVVRLTLDFYRRNYIEGLFLSSGVIRSSDYTMEQLVEVARSLREDHQFRGYIHLKTIPDAAPELIDLAGRYADRLSVNIELPTAVSIARLAPEKNLGTIRKAMARIRHRQLVTADDTAASGTADVGTSPHVDSTPASVPVTRAVAASRVNPAARARPPRFAPGGQSTQMIVGADEADDRTILGTAETLYQSYRLRRVYYSAFSPIPNSPGSVPLAPPPLRREHRLYQADFLIRQYGFTSNEIMGKEADLALDVDPKMAWALTHRELFPVDLNRAERGMIARVPGIGLRNAERIVALRQQRRLRYDDLVRLRCGLKNARAFIVVDDWRPRNSEQSSAALRQAVAVAATQVPVQASLW
ncbi:putative DNA modification/repair radical SAM protein [Robbsia sp. KACC 23696]|uniref:putative DNA modification/repair radical SAM protein n=1 Tax=Robbsia sp. KACC 23696 TaxID=3149231 RepID=UPI00325AC59A